MLNEENVVKRAPPDNSLIKKCPSYCGEARKAAQQANKYRIGTG